MQDVRLAVVSDTTTGLYHGAPYRNRPTPSGCDRWFLSVTVDDGHARSRDAARSANEKFPGVEPLDLDAFVEDTGFDGQVLPPGATVTKTVPRSSSDEPFVEVSRGGRRLEATIKVPGVDRLERLGHLRHDSCPGDDPELAYVYDTYEVVRSSDA